MNGDGIVERIFGQDIFQTSLAFVLIPQRSGRVFCNLVPYRLTAGCQSCVRNRHSQCFGNNLARSCCSQKLTAASGRSASSTSGCGCFFERHHAMTVTRTDRLNFPKIFRISRWQRHSPRNNDTRQLRSACQSEHHRR